MKALCALLALTLLAGCEKQPHDHPGQEGDHAHGPAEPAERPDLTVTLYQGGLELFMEYPALVVGQPSPLVAHFTDTRDPKAFHAVTRGRVIAVLTPAQGAEEKFIAEKPLRDGLFKPTVVPRSPGPARLTLVLESDQVSGTVEVGMVTVHPDLAAAVAAAPAEDPAAPTPLPFLKEQQWKTEYATAPAQERVLQGGIRATGELKPVAGQAAELSSPVAARVAVGGPVPHLGMAVKKGQLLVRLIPTALAASTNQASVELEVQQARAELGLAERELQRAESLLAAQAIPEKQLDAARVARQNAAARLGAAEKQQAQFGNAQSGRGAGGGSFELSSPLDGVVSFADVTPGAVVDPGARLISVVNADRLWLEAKVFEVDAPKIQQSPGATFTVAGFDRDFTVDEAGGGRRVAVGAVVDRLTRTVPVLFELPNPQGLLKPGMFAQVTLFTGQTVRGLTVPESAVIDDSGKPTLFVQEGGETFFKRVIKPGLRSGGYLQVLEGVRPDERVVSVGAYELKLSTATGAIPEHGHQH
ncbi:MAG: efflux RND transporter periplasmic adaptor subunit [Myxococcota bacterium]|nr:efflux RND transporter periplasmic adaptor subunit [Myxococcota bacterium]